MQHAEFAVVQMLVCSMFEVNGNKDRHAPVVGPRLPPQLIFRIQFSIMYHPLVSTF